jgi:hypothetical protein
MNYDHNKQDSYNGIMGSPMDAKKHPAHKISHPHGNHGVLSDIKGHDNSHGRSSIGSPLLQGQADSGSPGGMSM